MKNSNFKKILAGITAVTLASAPVIPQSGAVSGTVSVPKVLAAEEELSEISGEGYFPQINEYSSESNEAFAMYVQNVFYGKKDTSPIQEMRAERIPLDSEEQRILGEAKVFAKAVADGEKSSAVLDITVTAEKAISITDPGDFASFLNRIMVSLMYQCPYEMYWFDKTTGVQPVAYYDNLSKEHRIRFYFSVIKNYRESQEDIAVAPGKSLSEAELLKISSVNVLKTGAAKAAVSRAGDVIDYVEEQGFDEYQKLKYFKDFICEQTDYCYDAAAPDYPFGDPWQIIYVFDDDLDTRVVCEGYAKAFKYLCDVSGIDCKLASGYMYVDNQPGLHMWNIVSAGDNNYLVDVTNCDDDSSVPGRGAIGHNFSGGEDYLFMSAPSVTVESGCVFDDVNMSTLTYMYDEMTQLIYSDPELTVSSEEYHYDTNSDNYCDRGCGKLIHSVINQVTTTLDGTIGLNYYMSLPERITNDENAMVLYYVNGKQMTREYIKDAVKTEDGKYKFTYRVNAKEMSDIISLKIIDGNGREEGIYSNSGRYLVNEEAHVSGSSVDYSVERYFNDIKNRTGSSEMRELAKAALLYGNCAGRLFDYNPVSLSASDSDIVRAVSPELLEQYKISKTGDFPEGLTFKSMTLVLETETSMRFYFRADSADEYTFTVDGKEAVPAESGSGDFYIEISNISAQNLDRVYTFSINGEECVIKASALSYAYTSVMNEGPSSETVRALYLYNRAADNYFKRKA